MGVWSETLHAWSNVVSGAAKARSKSARARKAVVISNWRVKRAALWDARPPRRGAPHVTPVERALYIVILVSRSCSCLR